MEHHEMEQALAVERYLLGDMTTAEVAQFEEHMFICPECAEAVKTGVVFVENARAVFREPLPDPGREATAKTVRWKPTPWWKRLLAPAFLPALAALALVCLAGYQQLVVIRGLRTQLAEATAPQSLASFALHAVSRSALQSIVVPANARFFSLYFDVAQESASGYSCSILDGAGSVKFTEHLLPAKPETGGVLTLLIGRSGLPEGNYTLVVGVGSPQATEIGRYPFKIEYQ